MDLKDFIKEAIRDISEAINESNHELSELGVLTNPEKVSLDKRDDIYGHVYHQPSNQSTTRPVHLLSFDVAVSSTKKENGKEGIGVKVVGISLGKENEKNGEQNSLSRLKFELPIAFPTSKK